MRYNSIMSRAETRHALKPIRETGVSIPSVIFGTSSFGNLYNEVSLEEKTQVVQEIKTHRPSGMVFDSAGKYGAGLALESLGKVLGNLGVPKEQVLISNKLGWRRVPLVTEEPTFEPGVWVGLEHDAAQDISYDGIIRCWEDGNQLLGDYSAQLVSVHDPDEYLAMAEDEQTAAERWDDIAMAYKALLELRENGLAKAVGVGSKDWRVAKRVADSFDLDWVMLANSLTVYRHDPELLEFVDQLHQRGVAVINSAIFHGGYLVGGEFFDYRELDPKCEMDAGIIRWRDEFNTVCQSHDVLPANACAEFAVSHPGVASLSLSTSRPSYVRVNLELPEVRLGNHFWAEMKRRGLISSGYPYLGT